MIKEFCDICGKEITKDMKASIIINKPIPERFERYKDFVFCYHCLDKIDSYVRSNLEGIKND